MLLPRTAMFALGLLSLVAAAQPVISTHSGVIVHSEGTIRVDGKPVVAVPGRFPEIPPGSSIETFESRAEVLLGPETFLWLDHHSSLRMLRNGLEDTRVELISGSAILDSTTTGADSTLTISCESTGIRLAFPGSYRLDASESNFSVFDGSARLSNGTEKQAVLAPAIVNLRSGATAVLRASAGDEFDHWVQNRRTTIAAANLARARTETGPNRPTRRRLKRSVFPFPAAALPLPRRM